MNMKDIAINAINKTGKQKDWGDETKLIRTCEFITSQDLDEQFEKFLEGENNSQRT